MTVDLVEELGADSYMHGHTNDGGRMVIRADARVQLTQGATIRPPRRTTCTSTCSTRPPVSG